jgi:hypothetical protein
MRASGWLRGAGAGLLLGLGACHGAAPAAGPAPAGYTLVRTWHLPDSVLFRDAAGHLCLRLPYRYVHEDMSQDPPYNFQDCVAGVRADECLPLGQVLDLATFRRVSRTANYWQDKRNFYADPWVPYPGQYFFVRLGRRGQVRLLADPDFARCRGRLYYRGVHVPGDTVPRAGHYP